MIYDVEIKQLPLMALFDLKGTQAALEAWCKDALPPFPEAPLTRNEVKEHALMWLGPEHWILRAPLADEATLAAVLRPESAPDEISIVRVSDSFAFFAIAGPEVGEIVAVASPLDVHPSQFPPLGATFTEVFGLRALVLRVPGGFHIGADQSFAPMIADYLAKVTSPAPGIGMDP